MQVTTNAVEFHKFDHGHVSIVRAIEEPEARLGDLILLSGVIFRQGARLKQTRNFAHWVAQLELAGRSPDALMCLPLPNETRLTTYSGAKGRVGYELSVTYTRERARVADRSWGFGLFSSRSEPFRSTTPFLLARHLAEERLLDREFINAIGLLMTDLVDELRSGRRLREGDVVMGAAAYAARDTGLADANGVAITPDPLANRVIALTAEVAQLLSKEALRATEAEWNEFLLNRLECSVTFLPTHVMASIELLAQRGLSHMLEREGATPSTDSHGACWSAVWEGVLLGSCLTGLLSLRTRTWDARLRNIEAEQLERTEPLTNFREWEVALQGHPQRILNLCLAPYGRHLASSRLTEARVADHLQLLALCGVLLAARLKRSLD